MKLSIEITEQTLRRLVMEHIQTILGDVPCTQDDVKIEVKSKQNYKSEWEPAAYRAVVDKTIDD